MPNDTVLVKIRMPREDKAVIDLIAARTRSTVSQVIRSMCAIAIEASQGDSE
jgi:ribbon-helix-helix CopG family protein